MPCPRRGIRGRVPTATGGPPYSRKGEGDHLSRLTEARLGSGLGQAPSPARAGAQDTGADSPTLRILAWVQTESGVHTSVQKEATRPVGSGDVLCGLRRLSALRATVAETCAVATSDPHGHPYLGPDL